MELPRILSLASLLIVSSIAYAAPEWIWVEDGRKDKARAEFTQTFEVPG
ncbi:uncharacterized protein METZ01_LOCUS322651, partial [marine metagenome]